MTGPADSSPSLPRETIGLRFAVFFLVSAGLTTIYLVQPVLPVLQQEFGVDETRASWAISAVVLGIALSNLPFGRLADLFGFEDMLLIDDIPGPKSKGGRAEGGAASAGSRERGGDG